MSLNFDRSNWRTVRFGDIADRSREQSSQSDGSIERYVAGGHFDECAMQVTRWGEPDDGGMGSTFTYAFHPGHTLYVSASWYLRKAAVATFDGVVADKTYVIETRDPLILDPQFLPWILVSDRLHEYAAAQSTGSMNARLLWSTLANFELGLPPLDEQKRIADLLWSVERHRHALGQTAAKLKAVEARSLEGSGSATWPMRTVADLGDVQLGQQLHPKYRSGPKMRKYLRVANVLDDRLQLDDVLEMDFSDARAEKFRLQHGDVLLNEGQSIELVGRCAMFRDEIPDCYMQKTLLRFRAGPELLPDFALAWFRRCFLLGDFAKVAKRTTTMAHLTGVRFSSMPMPAPPMSVQKELVARAGALKAGRHAVDGEANRLQAVRSAFLAEIFGGN
ncbi:restriction endonuclease subunit S [Microbacterium sp.]|uniref:restriction endonuclease subunit S n=1 Tax=Microbacterium sp. TaxID=51671 RepID=UPI0027369F7F|nr:restriction endonuclease subunit S [Microbacterium sp.]MDP3949187.1 restriction endonuclease subunit S [Microbacterium sp.]